MEEELDMVAHLLHTFFIFYFVKDVLIYTIKKAMAQCNLKRIRFLGGGKQHCESIHQKFRDCIKDRRAWWWANFIMCELCGVRTCNYGSFHWKHAPFWVK